MGSKLSCKERVRGHENKLTLELKFFVYCEKIKQFSVESLSTVIYNQYWVRKQIQYREANQTLRDDLKIQLVKEVIHERCIKPTPDLHDNNVCWTDQQPKHSSEIGWSD